MTCDEINTSPIEVVSFCGFTKEQKISILFEAMQGKKSLANILKENNISEETFYTWVNEQLT